LQENFTPLGFSNFKLSNINCAIRQSDDMWIKLIKI